MSERPAATGQIEQWPYGPQAAAKLRETLERSVARQRIRPDPRRRIPRRPSPGRTATRLPFPRSAKRRRPRTTGRTPQARRRSPLPRRSRLHRRPLRWSCRRAGSRGSVDCKSTGADPRSIKQNRVGALRSKAVPRSGSTRRNGRNQSSRLRWCRSGRHDSLRPPSAGSSAPVATAVQTSAALPTQPAAAPVAQPPVVRSPSGPADATASRPGWPPTRPRQSHAATSALSTSGIRVGCQAHRSGWVWHPEHKMETRFLARSYGQGGSYPPGWNGWQRQILQMPRSDPEIAPYLRTAPMKYSLHDG